jgi:hypothetical protein
MANPPSYKSIAPPTTPRRCLGGCNLLFPSHGVGHRICPKCSGKNAGLSKQAAESTSASVDCPENDLPGYG